MKPAEKALIATFALRVRKTGDLTGATAFMGNIT
jgi:hypothetical protein